MSKGTGIAIAGIWIGAGLMAFASGGEGIEVILSTAGGATGAIVIFTVLFG